MAKHPDFFHLLYTVTGSGMDRRITASIQHNRNFWVLTLAALMTVAV